MGAVWWTAGVFAIVLYTLWAAGAFKKKSTKSIAEGEKKRTIKDLV